MCKGSIKHLQPLLLLFLFLSPALAYANAGTPLMWLIAGHLIMGNAIIGIFEGFIIAKFFKNRYVRSISIMILANYISMVIGIFTIGILHKSLRGIASINNILYVILGTFLITYVITIIAEWPFCFWIMKGKEARGRRSLKASIILQTLSYAVLIPLYLSASGVSLITNVKVDNTLSFLKTNNALIYFISLKDGALYRINADRSGMQKVEDAGLKNEYSELFICNKNGKSTLNAYWYVRVNNKYEYRSKVLLDDVRGFTAVSETCDSKDRWYGIDFRPENMRDWKISTGTWAIEGLRGKNVKTGETFRIALETPLEDWPISKASILPGDQVICQIGPQIVLVDLNTRHIGLITFGLSPVVILEK